MLDGLIWAHGPALSPLVATEDPVTKGFKLRITEAEEKEALSVPGLASQVLQVLLGSEGIRSCSQVLLLRTNGGLSVQSLTVTLESLEIAKLSSWVPLILGTSHGLRDFFGRFWEFFVRLLLVRLGKDMVGPVSEFAQDGSSTSGQRRPGFCTMVHLLKLWSCTPYPLGYDAE